MLSNHHRFNFLEYKKSTKYLSNLIYHGADADDTMMYSFEKYKYL